MARNNKVAFMLMRYMAVLPIFLFSFSLTAQEKIWDGEAGDSAWNNPLNWVGDQLPQSGDSVLLDNTTEYASYTVVLPSGSAVVTVHHLSVLPSHGRTIQIIVPVSSTAVPAFTTTGKGGLQLFNGALFKNVSGAASGTPISISDSIYIYEGGRFVQQSSTAHASIVNTLAKNPLTAKGIFEYDVPGHASYTVSLTGRTYGHLQFSSNAAGGSKTYLSSGSSAAKIRGDFSLGKGVNYNLNYSGSISIENDLNIIGVWNLSTGTLGPTVFLKGNLNVEGEIIETGSGLPVLEFAGMDTQMLDVKGAIKNSITCRLNNVSGAKLCSALRLPYRLQLMKGKMYSSWEKLLVLQANAWAEADSVSGTAYIKGPVQKLGMSLSPYMNFPVGGEESSRWLSVQSATGNMAVEYVQEPATAISELLAPELVRVSKKEYWRIRVDSFLKASLELSFKQPNSGSISDLNSLAVAIYGSGLWRSLGRMGTTGLASVAGSVISLPVQNFDTGYQYCSLAAELYDQNILPFNPVKLQGKTVGTQVELEWLAEDLTAIDHWQLESSSVSKDFVPIHESSQTLNRKWKASILSKPQFFRVKITGKDGQLGYSNVFYADLKSMNQEVSLVSFVYSLEGVHVKMELPHSALLDFQVLDMNGRLVAHEIKFVPSGTSKQSLKTNPFSSGVFVLRVVGPEGTLFSKKFLK